MSKKDIYIVLLKDGDCFGHSQFMEKKEADRYTSTALELGYHAVGICVNKLFESDRYIVCPVKGE